MQIIAFAGLAKTGKTTAAETAGAHLFELGFTPTIEQFAGPLKRAAAMLGFHKGGDTDHLYRWFCQMAGERARQENPDWFVNLMRDRLDVLAQEEADRINAGGEWHETVVFIDDLRFDNERELVREYGGKTLFVSAARRLTDMTADWRKHVSEEMARQYEAGKLADDTFDISLSNNDPKGLASFLSVTSTMCEQLITNAREIR